MNHNNHPNYAARRAVAATGLVISAGLAGGAVNGIHHALDAKHLTASEPACENVVPGYGEGVDTVLNRLDKAGGHTSRVAEIYTHKGVKRTLENTPKLNDQFSNVQASDTLRVEHLNPAVCLEIGGTVVQAAMAHDK